MNYYERLAILKDATPIEIKRAYFLKVKQHSPDADPEGFKAVRKAYETLSNAKKRSEYDQSFLAELTEDEQRIVVHVRELFKDSYFNAAVAYLKEKQTTTADVAIKRLYAEALWKIKKNKTATDICDELLANNPADALTYVLKGKIAVSKNHRHKAGEFFEKAVELDKKNPYIWTEYLAATISTDHGIIGSKSAYIVLKTATKISKDMFKDNYLLYLNGSDELARYCYDPRRLPYYELFAKYFAKDQHIDQQLFNVALNSAVDLFNCDKAASAEYLRKVVPVLEKFQSRFRSSDAADLRNMNYISILKFYTIRRQLQTDRKIHDVLVELTEFCLTTNADVNLAEDDKKIADLKAKYYKYITSKLSEIWTSIKNFQQRYPEYFKLNEQFYLECLDMQKAKLAKGKYGQTHRNLNKKASQEHNALDETLETVAMQPKATRVSSQNSQQTIAKSPKVGRNEPCPCGSGKKYKKCCG